SLPQSHGQFGDFQASALADKYLKAPQQRRGFLFIRACRMKKPRRGRGSLRSDSRALKHQPHSFIVFMAASGLPLETCIAPRTALAGVTRLVFAANPYKTDRG